MGLLFNNVNVFGSNCCVTPLAKLKRIVIQLAASKDVTITAQGIWQSQSNINMLPKRDYFLVPLITNLSGTKIYLE